MRKWSIGRSPDVFFLRIVKNRLGTRLYVYMLCAKWGKERCDSTQGDTSTAVRLSDVEYYIIVHGYTTTAIGLFFLVFLAYEV